MAGMPINKYVPMSRAQMEREVQMAEWCTFADDIEADALRSYSLASGPREPCRKCRLPKGDRRRPKRHHLKCPLRGAGRFKVILRIADELLGIRAGGLGKRSPDRRRKVHVWWAREVWMPLLRQHRVETEPRPTLDAALEPFAVATGRPGLAAVTPPIGMIIPADAIGGECVVAWIGELALVKAPTYADGRRGAVRVMRGRSKSPAAFRPGASPQLSSLSMETVDLHRFLARQDAPPQEVVVYAPDGVDESVKLAACEVLIHHGRVAKITRPKLKAIAQRVTERVWNMASATARAELAPGTVPIGATVEQIWMALRTQRWDWGGPDCHPPR
jgi:hypothetical protein